MTTAESSGSIPPLTEGFVGALVNPDVAYRPFGRQEPLSDYLYRQFQATGRADTITGFIDAVEPFINKEDGGVIEEYNEMKIRRMTALIADIPKEVPVATRMVAWEHLLSSDWVHQFGDPEIIIGAVSRMGRENPFMGRLVTASFDRLMQAKAANVQQAVAWSNRQPVPLQPDFDIHAALNEMAEVGKSHSEGLPAYHSLLSLGLIARSLRHQDEAA
jgi:hypothetical protein